MWFQCYNSASLQGITKNTAWRDLVLVSSRQALPSCPLVLCHRLIHFHFPRCFLEVKNKRGRRGRPRHDPGTEERAQCRGRRAPGGFPAPEGQGPSWVLKVSDKGHHCSRDLQPKPHRQQSASYCDELSEAVSPRTEGCSSRVTVNAIPAVQRHLTSLCSFALT